MSTITQSKPKFYKRPLFWVLVILLGASSIVLWNLRSNHTEQATEPAKTTSQQKTAQNTYTSGQAKNPSEKNSVNQGGAVDNNNPVVVPPDNQQKSSDSGAITLYKPTEGSTIQNGSTISGKATVNPVYFRLVDDAVGVTAQGPLNVVDGTFSGALQFASKGKTGTLKVYSVDPDSGREINLVQVHVAF